MIGDPMKTGRNAAVGTDFGAPIPTDCCKVSNTFPMQSNGASHGKSTGPVDSIVAEISSTDESKETPIGTKTKIKIHKLRAEL